jgi:hypothetical protein
MQSLALAAEELFSVDILLQVTCVVKAARDPRFQLWQVSGHELNLEWLWLCHPTRQHRTTLDRV